MIQAMQLVDTMLIVGMRLGNLPSGFQFFQRQAIRIVSIYLVGRSEDEYSLRAIQTSLLQKIECPISIDCKVRQWLSGSPVMTRLSRSMDDQFNISAIVCK